jgi:hypothetical protein
MGVRYLARLKAVVQILRGRPTMYRVSFGHIVIASLKNLMVLDCQSVGQRKSGGLS